MISEKIQQEKQERKCGGMGEGASQQHRSSKQLLQGEGEKKENTEGGIHRADQPLAGINWQSHKGTDLGTCLEKGKL